MKRERLADLDVVLAGGTDRHGGGDGPLVVLLHGFGAPAEDLVPLAHHLRAPPGTRFLCPGAPIPLGIPFSDARAWWLIDLGRLERERARGGLPPWSQEAPAGLAAARARLVELLALCQTRLGAPPARTVLGGFSQGAMLATDVALRTTTPLAGLLLFSGTIICEPEWTPLLAARRGLPVFMAHGQGDPMLPFVLAQRLRLLLEDAGADVSFTEFAGGHEIPPPALDDAGAFLQRVLG